MSFGPTTHRCILDRNWLTTDRDVLLDLHLFLEEIARRVDFIDGRLSAILHYLKIGALSDLDRSLSETAELTRTGNSDSPDSPKEGRKVKACLDT